MRRRGQSDERRRRVFSEDAAATDEKTRKSKSRRSSRSAEASDYNATALDHQIQITDFVPRPAWAYVLLLAWGSGLIAGLLWAFRQLPGAGPRSAIFDLTWTGSLASWFASFTLVLVAASAIICYSLRRHKLSDYHGRYRIWRWTAAVALLASVAATTSWHQVVGWELGRAMPWQLPSGGLLMWLVPSVLVLAVFAIRLLLELRTSRGATVGLLAALLCYTVVIGHKLLASAPTTAPQTVMVTSGSLLAGHFLLLVAFLWFARHVILDIQGLLPRREQSSSTGRDKKSAGTSNSRASRREDPPHDGVPRPARRSDLDSDMPATRKSQLMEEAERQQEQFEQQQTRTKRTIRTRKQPVEREEYDEPQADRQRKISKSERKRQRKLKAEQRRAA